MPKTYEVDYGGKTYEVDAPDPQTAWDWAKRKHEETKAARPGLLGSFMEAATTIPRMGAQAAAYAADPTEENRLALLKAGETKYQPVGGFSKKNTLGENIEAAKELIGGSVGQAVAPAIVGTGAAAAGAPLGGVGALVTGPTAGYATNTAQYTIQNLYRQAREQQDAIDAGKAPNHAAVGKAFVAATGQAGLDLAGQQIFAPLTKAFPFAKNLIFGGGKAASESAEVLEEAIAKGTLKAAEKQGYTGNILKGVGKGVAFEVPQEIAQTAIERWQAGLSLTDADAQEEYKQAAIGAAFLGPLFGGATGALETRARNAKAETEEGEKVDNEPPVKGESSYTPPAGVDPATYKETFARFQAAGLDEEEAHDAAVQALTPDFVAGGPADDVDGDIDGGLAAGVSSDLGGGVGAPIVRGARKAAERGVEPVSTGADVAVGGAGPSDGTLSDGEVGVRPPATKQAINAATRIINKEFTDTSDEFVENRLTPAQRIAAATIYANNIDAGPGAALQQVLTPKPVEQTVVEMAPVDQPIAAVAVPKKVIPTLEEAKAAIAPKLTTTPPAAPVAAAPVAAPAPTTKEKFTVEGYVEPPPAPVDVSAPRVSSKPQFTIEPEAAPTPAPVAEPVGEPVAEPDVVEPEVTAEPAPEPAAEAAPTLHPQELEFLRIDDARAGMPLEIEARNGDMIFFKGGTSADIKKGPDGSFTVRDALPHGEQLHPEVALTSRNKIKAIAEVPAAIEKLRAETAAKLRERTGVAAPEAAPAPAPAPAPAVPAPARAPTRARTPAVRGAGKKGKTPVAAPVEATRADVDAAIEDYRAKGVSEEKINSWYNRLKLGAKPKYFIETLRREGDEALAAAAMQTSLDRERAARAANAAAEAEAKLQAAQARSAELKAAREAAEAKKKAAEEAAAKASAEQGPVDAEETKPNGDPLDEVSRRVEHDLEGKNSFEVAKWLVKNAPDGFRKEVATKIQALMRNLRDMGVDFDFDIIHLGEPTRASRARGYNTLPLDNHAKVMTRIHGSDVTGVAGTSYRIVLHEFIHAVTMGTIRVGKLQKYQGTPAAKMAIKLHELREAVVKHFNARVKAKAELTPIEQEYLARKNNMLDNTDELIAWGLSDRRVQEWLDTIPYKGTVSVWKQFVSTMREFLGLAKKDDTALSELLRVSEELLSMKKKDLGPWVEHTSTVQRGVAAGTDTSAAIDSAKGPTKAQLRAEAAAKKPSTAQEKVNASIDAQRAATGDLETATKEGLDEGIGATIEDHDPNTLKDQFGDQLEGVRAGLLELSSKALPTSAIIDWVGAKVPALARIVDAVNAMNAMRNNILAGSNKLVTKLDAFVRKHGLEEIASAMHIARLSGVNPMAHPDLATALKNDFVRKKYASLLTDPNLKPSAKGGYTRAYNQRAKELTETYKAWEALGKQEGGQQLYREVRQYYKDMYTALRSRLDKNIRAMDISDDSKKNLLAFVRLQKEQGKGSLQAEDYPDVDPSEFPDEYFPFKRFGDNWLDVDASLDRAKGRQFYMFDSKAAMLAFRRKIARDAGISPNDPRLKMGFNTDDLHKHMEQNSAMLKEMFAEIEKAFANNQALGKTEKDKLKDALYQVYLMTLPERSIRRQFVHSKNVTGFSADVLRTLKTSASQYANQLAKLKYATQVEREIESANDDIHSEDRPSDEAAKLDIFKIEIAQRARDQVNPPERGAITSALNNASFLMFLTSGATAATQFTGIPIRVMPRLLRLYGLKGTMDAMTKWTALHNSIGVRQKQSDGTTKWVFPSAEHADMVKNNPLYRKAFDAGNDRGVFGALTESLIENKPTATGPVQNAAQQGLSATYDMLTGLFNASEKTSREITYMMGFDQEYKKTKDFDAAVRAGAKLVDDTLGNYTGVERPSITTANDLARLVFLFKMYAINTTKFFVQNAHAVSKGDVGAMLELGGVLSMGALFHGLTGMPIYSLVNATINALTKGEDDEEKRQNFMADDADYRFRYQFMPKHFGQNTFMGHSLAEIGTVGLIPAVTGANIGSRTSFDNMWFREGKPGQNWAETVQNTILANIAGASLVPNFVGAIQDFNEGNITRGLEQALPGFFKGAATAYRLKTEGAETRGGDQLLNANELTDAQLVAQVIGFQPTKLSQVQQQAYALKKRITAVDTQRRQLMQKLNSELYEDQPDKAKIQKTIEKMMEFNAKYPFPDAQITMETLDDSWRAYQQKRQYMLRGLAVTKKQAPYVLPDLIRTYEGYEDYGT